MIIVIKNHLGGAPDKDSVDYLNRLPGPLSRLHRAHIVLSSTKTGYFTFGIKHPVTDVMEYTEERERRPRVQRSG